ncbi:hypothetical protein [Yersinia pekkanenii]|nr:hypothetical protein [Yersinia pekkanenii]
MVAVRQGCQWWAGIGDAVSSGAWSCSMSPPQLMAVLQTSRYL